MSESFDLIIHNECGLPIELCTCKNAQVVYDPITDRFVDLTQERED